MDMLCGTYHKIEVPFLNHSPGEWFSIYEGTPAQDLELLRWGVSHRPPLRHNLYLWKCGLRRFSLTICTLYSFVTMGMIMGLRFVVL